MDTIALVIALISLLGNIIYNYIITSRFPSKKLCYIYCKIMLKELDEIEKFIIDSVRNNNILNNNIYFETFISAKNKYIRELLRLVDNESGIKHYGDKTPENIHEKMIENMEIYETIIIKMKDDNGIKENLPTMITKIVSCKKYINELIYKRKFKS